MRKALPRLLVLAAFVLAGVYLARVDYAHKLDTDVSSLLPQVESPEAKIARQLISEEQGRAVYLEAKGLPETDEAQANFGRQLEEIPWIESAVRFDERANLSALSFVNEHRLELLFPKWLAEKKDVFDRAGSGSFAEWAAVEAVADMDSFLESPSAIELARDELMDPLLLSVGAILRLSEGGSAPLLQEEEDASARSLFWVKLSQSPLARDTQEGLAADLTALEAEIARGLPEFKLSYGGLVRLAAASRERIQRDVFKINLLSIVGVTLAGCLLTRRPWRLLWAIPTVLAGVVGALTVSFLVFESVNVIVLVVGSILIGTAIDYAIHLIFKDMSVVTFPTTKLVAFACFSTVAGFAVLLFAELGLIRQIGVFVGAGLLSAFLVARVSIRSASAMPSKSIPAAVSQTRPHAVWTVLSVGVFLAGIWGLFGLHWVDDLRKLEAPDEALVSEDLALRAKFGADLESSVFITTGESYLEVMERESALVNHLKSLDAEMGIFGFSQFAPTEEEAALVVSSRSQLPLLFEQVQTAFDAAGFEGAAFDRFFREAEAYGQGKGMETEQVENLLGELSTRLRGPMEGSMGSFEGRYWSLTSARVSPVSAMSVLDSVDGSFLFSQLSFFNKALGKHREAFLGFGMWAAALVGAVMLIVFGFKRGGLIILYPLFGGSIAIGLCSLAFGALNMFHLVGCFLGGAIALDYALFAIEAYGRGMALPRSVWLSAGTTTASFLALGFSSVPVVQGLGWLVALLACVTLLLLHSSQPFLRRFLRDDGSN